MESMVFSTESENLYLYDAKYMFSILLHPDLVKVYHKYSDTDPYYFNKYRFLIRYGFFGKSDPVEFETKCDEISINENIIKTNQIVFDVTDRCNLHCLYCTFGDLYERKEKKRKNINYNYANNFLSYIFGLKIKNGEKKLTISFYGGEPLVNMRFIKQIVNSAHRLNIGEKLKLTFRMTTNATLIHKYIDFLVKNDFGLLISLDGDEEGQSYRVFVGGNKNSFCKVIENIDMIQKCYPEYFKRNVHFNSVLHGKNTIKCIYEYIYSRYNKIPRISQLNTADVKTNKKECFDSIFRDKRESEDNYQNEESNLLPAIREEFTSYKELSRFVKNYSVNFYISNFLYVFYDKINVVPTGTCKPFEKKMFLSTQHYLYPCERINAKYSMGKVNRNVMIDISGIARQFTLYYEKFAKICKNCYSCPRDCVACMLTIGNIDKLDEEEVVCYGFEDQKKFVNKLNRVFSLLEKNPSDYLNMTENMLLLD